VDVIVGLEDADFVVRKLNAAAVSSVAIRDGKTDVKPLMRVNSCLISPPSALAFSLALLSSSALAFSLSVT
jgi:hypothetical protein